MFVIFFFKQKTAYEMRISDWSSDVCSSDLGKLRLGGMASEGDRTSGSPRPDELPQGRTAALCCLPCMTRQSGRKGRERNVHARCLLREAGSGGGGASRRRDRHARARAGRGPQSGRTLCRERVCLSGFILGAA